MQRIRWESRCFLPDTAYSDIDSNCSSLNKGRFIHVLLVLRRFMSDHVIAVLPGDGTGKEVAIEAQRILDTIQEHTNHGFDQTVIQCGGQYYQETGKEWAEGSFDFCRDEADAIIRTLQGKFKHKKNVRTKLLQSGLLIFLTAH